MKAWVLHRIDDLRFEEVPTPVPKEGEVLVQIKAAGICSSDIPRVFTAGAYHYPIILGHEFSGITEDGRRVGVFPLLPCFECESCRQGYYETCSNYSYIGSRCDGAFAEYVAVPEWNLIELPDHVTYEQAAMLEPVAVALHAAKQLTIDSGRLTAAVVGAGTIGRLIALWLEIFGITATLIDRNDSPLQQFDACVEAVGSINSLQCCIEFVKPNGQLVLVGNPAADFSLTQKHYWKILRKQLTVCGSWNSRYPEDWRFVLEHLTELNLDELISRRYSFDQLDTAFNTMRIERHGKVIINYNW